MSTVPNINAVLQVTRAVKAGQKHFVIANWASMKTGKSTYLNALMQKSLLSSSNQAETSGITIIRNDPLATIPKLFAVANINVAFGTNAVAGQLLAEGEQNVRDKIREINANLRTKASNEHSMVLLVTKIECMQNCTNVELWDTPGPNEAANKHVAELAKQALLHCNYIQMLFDYSNCCCSNDEEAMCKLVSSTRPDLLKPETMHIIVNKVDTKAPDGKSFDEMQQLVKTNLSKFTGKTIANSQLVMFISARKALEASRMLNNGIQENSEEAQALLTAYSHCVDTFEELKALQWQKTLEKSNIIAAQQFITTASTSPKVKTAALQCTVSTLLPIVEQSILSASNAKQQEYQNELSQITQQLQQKQQEFSKLTAQYQSLLALPITVSVPFSNNGSSKKTFTSQQEANQFAANTVKSCSFTLQSALDNQLAAKVLDINSKLIAFSQALVQYNKCCVSNIAAVQIMTKPTCIISCSPSTGSYVKDASYDQPYQASKTVTVQRQVPRQVTKKQRIFGIVIDKETYTVYETHNVPETQYYTAYNRISSFEVNEHGIMQEVWTQYQKQETTLVAALKSQFTNAITAVFKQVNQHNEKIVQQYQQQKAVIDTNIINSRKAATVEIEQLKQQNN